MKILAGKRREVAGYGMGSSGAGVGVRDVGGIKEGWVERIGSGELRLADRPGRRRISHRPPYRVLFTSPCWYRGGLETVTINHLMHLPRDCWEASLLVGISEEMSDSIPPGIQMRVDQGCFDWDFPPTETEKVKERAVKVLNELAPDIVVGQLSHALFYAAQECGVPVLVEYMHSGGGWDILDRPSDFAIAVSRAAAAMAVRNRSLKVPIHVVHNGVDARLFFPDIKGREEVRSGLKISPKEKVVLYLGRISGEKDPVGWITILSELHKADPTVKGLMVGSYAANHHLWHRTQERAKECGLVWGKDVFHASVAYDQVREYISASDLMMHTCHHETFGMCVVEALFCGVPVIGFDGGGVGEIAELMSDSVALRVVQNGDQAALRQAAQSRLGELPRPTILAGASRKARQLFSAAKSTEVFASYLEKAIRQLTQ